MRHPRHRLYLGEPERIPKENGVYVRRMASVYVYPSDSDYLKSSDDCVGVYTAMWCGEMSMEDSVRLVTNELVRKLIDTAIVKGTRVMGVDK